MAVTVKTFSASADAARVAGSEREAEFLGGGTLVMRRLNEGDLSLSTLLRVTDPSLKRIDTSGSRITLGAAVTFARVLGERDLAFLHPVARSIGGPAVRNMGTVGGNLFAPVPFGDFATALLALDATVATMGSYGARDVPVEEFLDNRSRMHDVLVTAVSFVRPSSPDAFRYKKIARVKPKGASVITIAAMLPNSGGRIQGARIAFGAMGPIPLRAKSAERALEGRTLDSQTLSAAAAAALEGLQPQDDALASAWYRREVVGVHLRRLLNGEA